MACESQALEASDELRDSLEQEHKEVGRFIAAWYAGDVSHCFPFHPCCPRYYPHDSVKKILHVITG